MGYDNRYTLTIKGELPSTIEEIMNELRTEDNDSGYLLDEDGSSYETGSGWNIEEEVQEFSKKYPTLIFQLDCEWDSGFGDPPSRYYYKNGVKQGGSAKISYDEPDFE